MATDYYLKIEGVDGEATDEKHKKWIEIDSFSWGCNQEGTFGSRTGGGGGGKVAYSDISFTMSANKASPVLMEACATGKHYTKATLSLARAGEQQVEYYKIEFADVLVSSYQSSGSSGGDSIPMESFSLNFAKIVFNYTPQKDEGGKGTAVPGGFDLQANKKIASI